jgi:transposase-like protein
VWLDATYVHVREAGQVVSKAVVIATGLRADGYREVLGVDVGDSENETFWTEFLRDLKDRGLDGVQAAGGSNPFQGATRIRPPRTIWEANSCDTRSSPEALSRGPA